MWKKVVCSFLHVGFTVLKPLHKQNAVRSGTQRTRLKLTDIFFKEYFKNSKKLYYCHA